MLGWGYPPVAQGGARVAGGGSHGAQRRTCRTNAWIHARASALREPGGVSPCRAFAERRPDVCGRDCGGVALADAEATGGSVAATDTDACADCDRGSGTNAHTDTDTEDAGADAEDAGADDDGADADSGNGCAG
jgi:hypothetical protein